MGCSGYPPIKQYSLKYNLTKNTKDVSSIIELPSGNILTTGAHGILYIWNKGGYLGTKPVDDWYSEIKDYDFAKSEFSQETSHFT